jgi:hypothetical protein
MTTTDDPQARIAEYLRLSAEMRSAADRAFDPQIAAEYLALAAKWLRLAEEAERNIDVIDRKSANDQGIRKGHRHRHL